MPIIFDNEDEKQYEDEDSGELTQSRVMALIREVVEFIHKNGIRNFILRFESGWVRTEALSRCRKCKADGFNRVLWKKHEYWNCLECQFAQHLIGWYLQQYKGCGVVVQKIDKVISDVYAQNVERENVRFKKED